MATESIWDFPGDPDTTYGSLLARDHGVTPIYLRYNTGQHISVNGRELAGCSTVLCRRGLYRSTTSPSSGTVWVAW